MTEHEQNMARQLATWLRGLHPDLREEWIERASIIQASDQCTRIQADHRAMQIVQQNCTIRRFQGNYRQTVIQRLYEKEQNKHRRWNRWMLKNPNSTVPKP